MRKLLALILLSGVVFGYAHGFASLHHGHPGHDGHPGDGPACHRRGPPVDAPAP